MEKFSRWRDAGTGIQPFLPPKPPRSSQLDIKTILFYLKYSIAVPIAIVKFTIAAAVVVMIAVLDTLSLLLSFSAGLQRSWRRLYYPLFRLVLLLLGFYWIKSSVITLHKGVRKANAIQPSAVKSGDIIAANHISYIDILYFAFRLTPTFVEIGDNGTVIPINMWSALFGVGNRPTEQLESLNGVTLTELSDKLKNEGAGPVVVFPEGTTSNGRGLLKLLPVFSKMNLSKSRIHIIGLKYEYEDYSPSFTVGKKLFHAFWLSCQFANFLEVKHLPADEVHHPPTTISQKIAESDGPEDPMMNKIGTLMGQTLRIRRTGLGRTDKREFLDYFQKQSTPGSKRKQK